GARERALLGRGGIGVLGMPVAGERGERDDVVLGDRAARRHHRVANPQIVEVRGRLAPESLALALLRRLGPSGRRRCDLWIHGSLLWLEVPRTESAQVRRRRVSAGSTTSSTSPEAAATSAPSASSPHPAPLP